MVEVAGWLRWKSGHPDTIGQARAERADGDEMTNRARLARRAKPQVKSARVALGLALQWPM
jgi:hypothetical protein